MATPPIVAEHVRKRFRRGERHDSLRDLIPAVARRLTGRGRERQRDALSLGEGEFWALDDVSFAVRPGEALGIIGPNGAGKSTTLKLLTRILRPTSGRIAVRGRVGALIEVAAGFHPDLTGRENVFLQGAIIGMRRREIAAVLDRIVDFAGVEEFIDTPVKRYSSGMQARLGFAVAAHLRPDVLIIDEVLAVGDMGFQQKCVNRMKEFKRDGVAIVFVSHNMQAVADLCDRAIFLKRSVRAEGTPAEASAAFLASMSDGREAQTGDGVRILGARLTTAAGEPAEAVEPNTPLRLTVDYEVEDVAFDDVTFGFWVSRSTDWMEVFDGSVPGAEVGLPRLEPGMRFSLRFDFRAHLARGQYHVGCGVGDPRRQKHIVMMDPAALVTVHERRRRKGVADLELACARAG